MIHLLCRLTRFRDSFGSVQCDPEKGSERNRRGLDDSLHKYLCY